MKAAIAWERWESDLEQVSSGSLPIDVLLQRHVEVIRTFASRIHWAVGFEAEEAAQAVRLAVWYAVRRYDPSKRRSIAGWVAFIVNRRLKGYACKVGRFARDGEVGLDDDGLDEERTHELCDGEDCFPERMANALHNYERRVLGRMDADSRALLQAHFVDGQSPREIHDAGVLPGISYWWTVKRVHAVMRMATVLATEF